MLFFLEVKSCDIPTGGITSYRHYQSLRYFKNDSTNRKAKNASVKYRHWRNIMYRCGGRVVCDLTCNRKEEMTLFFQWGQITGRQVRGDISIKNITAYGNLILVTMSQNENWNWQDWVWSTDEVNWTPFQKLWREARHSCDLAALLCGISL